MSSRRNTTDESEDSITSSQVRDAGIVVRYLKATELEAASSDVVLQRSLTVRSIISTTSSFPIRFQRALIDPELQSMREIGQGLQAAIFEHVGHEPVMKKEHPRNARTANNLINEFVIHQLVYDAFQLHGPGLECNISVPRPMTLFTTENVQSYQDILDKLPKEFQTSSNLVQMEPVLPLPKVIRRALIDKFYPRDGDVSIDTNTLHRVLNHLPDKDCLVRPYLGMRNKTYAREDFSLRNFILDLPSMQQLDFEVEELSETLGRAYAIIQWGAHVDGDDVEFVLGSSTTIGPDFNEGPSYQHRMVDLFLIDFGQCEVVNMDSDPQVVYQAFKGAMVMGDNAYFIPNYRHTPNLFMAFADSYAQTAKALVHLQGLADKFDISEFMEQYKEYVEDFL